MSELVPLLLIGYLAAFIIGWAVRGYVSKPTEPDTYVEMPPTEPYWERTKP